MQQDKKYYNVGSKQKTSQLIKSVNDLNRSVLKQK